jgi:hypothetical protein
VQRARREQARQRIARKGYQVNEEYRCELQEQANTAKMILIGILREFEKENCTEDATALDEIITKLEVWQNT